LGAPRGTSCVKHSTYLWRRCRGRSTTCDWSSTIA
jgi:hypothetical protein